MENNSADIGMKDAFCFFLSVLTATWQNQTKLNEAIAAMTTMLLSDNTEEEKSRLILAYLKDHGKQQIQRTFHPKGNFAWFLHVGPERLFRALFRVSRLEFAFLVQTIKDKSGLYKRSYYQTYPNIVTVFEACGMCLHYLGTQCSMAKVMGMFGFHTNTCQKHINQVLCFLRGYFRRVVRMPESDKARAEMAACFLAICFIPGIIGAADCTHFPMYQASDKHAQYINRKGFHSLVFQGVSSPSRIFLDFYGGWAGSISDKSVWHFSGLYARFLRGDFATYSLLGDAIYPETEDWFLVPYDDLSTPSRINFNYWQSRGRIAVECAFGILKSRFRILRSPFTHDPEILTNIVVVCVVLHNILQCIHSCDDEEAMIEFLGEQLDFQDFESFFEDDDEDIEIPQQHTSKLRDAIAMTLPPRPAFPDEVML